MAQYSQTTPLAQTPHQTDFPCEWTGNYGITSNLIDSVVRGDLGGDIRIVWANGNESGKQVTVVLHYICFDRTTSMREKSHITVGAIKL